MGAMYERKTRFRKKDFVAFHNFKDEPEMIPPVFCSDKGSYEKLIKDVQNDIEIGVKVIDAIRLNAGVEAQTVRVWRRAFLKELEDGKTDTPLIRLFKPAYRSDAKLYRKVMSLALNKAEEGDASTIQYLAKHRLEYNSSNKQQVELSTTDEAPVKFVFADMTPVEVDDEEKEKDDL